MRFTWFLESNKPIGQEYKCRPIIYVMVFTPLMANSVEQAKNSHCPHTARAFANLCLASILHKLQPPSRLLLATTPSLNPEQ